MIRRQNRASEHDSKLLSSVVQQNSKSNSYGEHNNNEYNSINDDTHTFTSGDLNAHSNKSMSDSLHLAPSLKSSAVDQRSSQLLEKCRRSHEQINPMHVMDDEKIKDFGDDTIEISCENTHQNNIDLLSEMGITRKRVRKARHRAKHTIIRHAHNSKTIVLRRRIIALSVILLLLVAATIFVASGFFAAQNKTTVNYNEGEYITYNGHTYKLNGNMASICFVGYDITDSARAHGLNGQGDFIVDLALNLDTGHIIALIVPRDSMVEVGEYVGRSFLGTTFMQICLAFGYGTSPASGAEYTQKIVSRLLYNMPIGWNYAIDMDGMKQITQDIGGITLEALETIPQTSIREGETVTLSGEDALSYVQYRDASKLDSSISRLKRQTQFIQKFASKSINFVKENPINMVNMFNSVSSYSTTNLNVQDFLYLASKMIGKSISFETCSLKGEMTQGEVYAEYILDNTNVFETMLSVYYTQIS